MCTLLFILFERVDYKLDLFYYFSKSRMSFLFLYQTVFIYIHKFYRIQITKMFQFWYFYISASSKII